MGSSFEIISIDHQLHSESIDDAVHNFETSCRICCTSGIRIKCDACKIDVAHKMVVAAFSDMDQFIGKNRRKA